MTRERRGVFRKLAALLLGMAAVSVHAGSVVLYSSTDRQMAEPLIADFRSMHPDIEVVYHDLSTGDLHDRFLAELGTPDQADILWSSAINLQVKLVNDGYAAPHESDETRALPSWAIWKNEAFGTTFEPIVFVYNTRLITPANVPKTHAELNRYIRKRPAQPEASNRHRLATYDPRNSGLGYLLHTQDMEANPVTFWNLIHVSAHAGLILETTTTRILEQIADGRATIGYNVLGSYALNAARKYPDIGIALPSDYTLVLSRIALINRQAPHPVEARIWMDYMLSQRGQAILNRSSLFSVRDDVATDDPAAAELRRRLDKVSRPIAISTGLLTYLDKMKRELFLKHWDDTLKLDPTGEP